jgi:phenol 2-monooxygenase
MRGAMVVVRPDQYIGWVGDLEDVDEMTRYLDGVLIRKAANYCPQ